MDNITSLSSRISSIRYACNTMTNDEKTLTQSREERKCDDQEPREENITKAARSRKKKTRVIGC